MVEGHKLKRGTLGKFKPLVQGNRAGAYFHGKTARPPGASKWNTLAFDRLAGLPGPAANLRVTAAETFSIGRAWHRPSRSTLRR
jgi:hypothetical protein